MPPDPSGVLGRALEEVSSPPEGMYNSVFAAASFRNDGQLELLSAYFRVGEEARARAQFERELGPLLRDPAAAKGVRQAIEDMLMRRMTSRQGGTADSAVRFRDEVDAEFKKHVKEVGGAAKATEMMNGWLKARLQSAESVENLPQAQRFFSTATFECGGKAALSWYLSGNDRRRIERAIGKEEETPAGATDVPTRIQKLLEWWEPAK